MKEDASFRGEHKFDTLSLLAGLNEAELQDYSIEDILHEFEDKKTPESSVGDRKGKSGEPAQTESIIQQIRSAVDHELELIMPPPTPRAEPEARKSKAQKREERERARALRKQKKSGREPTREPEQPRESAREVIRLPAREPVREPAAEPVREPVPPAPETPQEPKPPLRIVEPVKRTEEAESPQPAAVPPPDAAELYKKVTAQIRPSRIRMTLVIILTAAAALATAIRSFGWSSAAFFVGNGMTAKLLLGLMVACALLAGDVIYDGLLGICALKFNLSAALMLSFLVSAADALLCGDEDPLPLCAAVCLGFCFALWNVTLKNTALRRSLRPLQKREGPLAAVLSAEKAWEGGSLLVAGNGSEESHVRGLLSRDRAEERMSLYAPIMAVVSLFAAFLVRFKTGSGVLWVWSALLAGGLPAAGFLCFNRPFSILAGRLMKEGCAIGGWTGTERLSGAEGVVLTDHDIFPPRQIKFGGIKIYDSHTMGEAVGYAAAVMEASGSGLTPVFQELRQTSNGRNFRVSQFRRYEGGGFGAEVAGDVILLGSLRFMQLMGVYMHEGTKVHDAVYLSVNGDLCAVFAVNHIPSQSVRRALHRILRISGLTPVFATRDFLLTPRMLSEKYKLSSEHMEFPPAHDRDLLAQLPEGSHAEQCAVMTGADFGVFCDAAAGGRILRLITSLSCGISILAGVIGLILLFILTYSNALGMVTGLHLIALELLWTVPVLILTSWIRRY